MWWILIKILFRNSNYFENTAHVERNTAMKDPPNTRCKLLIISLSNIMISVLYKLIMLSRNATGISVIVVSLLWFLIYRGKNWAYYIYGIFACIISLLGVLGFVLAFAYIYRGHNPISCFLLAIVGADYFVSWFFLRQIMYK